MIMFVHYILTWSSTKVKGEPWVKVPSCSCHPVGLSSCFQKGLENLLWPTVLSQHDQADARVTELDEGRAALWWVTLSGQQQIFCTDIAMNNVLFFLQSHDTLTSGLIITHLIRDNSAPRRNRNRNQCLVIKSHCTVLFLHVFYWFY